MKKSLKKVKGKTSKKADKRDVQKMNLEEAEKVSGGKGLARGAAGFVGK